jgi:hypothetical protein
VSHLDNYLRYKEDPWAFLMECVYTKDQVDIKTPIKLLPNREYGELYCKIWQKYPLLAVPKTRRMTMSWYTIALYTWDTIFHAGRLNAFVSKKEDDANELIERARFIVDNIPPDKLPRELVPKYKPKFNVLDFYEIGSKIAGFPQGADQLRQFTFSGIFGDESAFWEQAQEFYSASFPTIDGGGRMTLVSSPAPGFFKKLCFDAMDRLGEVNVEEFEPEFTRPLQGVRLWKNKKNRFLIFELHYTADPLKRAESYRESIKNSMPIMEYLREYELHWDTFAGYPVYPEFLKLHIAAERPTPQPGIPMLVGIDFGLTPAAVIGQMQEDQLFIFEELVEINMGSDRFAEKLSNHIKMYYPTFGSLRKDWLCFVDPAGLQMSQKDEAMCVQSLSAVGFVPRPGPVQFEARRKAVTSFLQKLGKKGPAFQIYSVGSPMLVKGFEGGYRFADKAGEVEPTKLRPIKDAYSHPHDALQYLCSGILETTAQLKRQVPRPVYAPPGQGRLRYG